MQKRATIRYPQNGYQIDLADLASITTGIPARSHCFWPFSTA